MSFKIISRHTQQKSSAFNIFLKDRLWVWNIWSRQNNGMSKMSMSYSLKPVNMLPCMADGVQVAHELALGKIIQVGPL